MSIPDLSARSGLSPVNIASIEDGEGVLSVSVLRALSKGLGVQSDELLRGLPMLSVTAETRHFFAAPTYMSSFSSLSSLSSSLFSSEGHRGLRGKAGGSGEVRAPKPAGARMPRSRAGEVALLSVLSEAAAKRPPA